MGTVCSSAKKTSAIGCSDGMTNDAKDSNLTNKRYNISASIVCSTIWNPFRITQKDAENLLQESYPGAFIFSHSVTNEIYLSMNTGKYVCHHPILRHAQHLEMGGRNFNNIEEALSFYRLSPLGDATLTEQFYSMYEASTETKQSHSLTSPKMTKSKPKTETPKQRGKAVSISTQASVINDSVQKTIHMFDEELSSQEHYEQVKKMMNKPRKSVCRVQPQESLSTSSENMFKEEEF